MPARAPSSANRCNPLHVAIGNNRAIAPRKSEAGRVQPAFMVSKCRRSRDRTDGRGAARVAARRPPGPPCRRAAVPAARSTAVRRPLPSAARAATGPESGILAVQGGGRVGSEAGLGEAGRPAGVRQAGRAGTGGPAGPGPPRGSPPGPGTPAPEATGAARREHDQMAPGRDAGDTPDMRRPEGGRAPRFSNGHLTGAICGSPCTRTPRCNSVTQPICLLAHRWRSYRSPATG